MHANMELKIHEKAITYPKAFTNLTQFYIGRTLSMYNLSIV